MRSLIFFLLLTLSLHSFAKINPTNRAIELSVEAELNSSSIGKIALIIEPDDRLIVKWNDVQSVFKDILLPEVFSKLSVRVCDGLLTQQAIEDSGFILKFDFSNFSLQISVPLKFISPRALTLKPDTRHLNAEKIANLSGFTNLYSSLLHRKIIGLDKSSRQLAMRAEMALNWRGWVVENEVEYISEITEKDSSFRRLGTRLTHDMPFAGMRISVGDNYSSGSYFQSTSRFLGVSLAHDFALVSNKTIRPSASRSFTLESPSSVEVLADSKIISRLDLGVGTYSLNDIPLREGSNNISLRITDIAGVVQYIEFDVTTGLDLFAQGQLEYEIHLGIPSNLTERLEYSNDYPLLSSYLDYGVSPSWTAGLTLQMDEYVQQLGFKNIFATQLGKVALENAISFNDRTGHAYRLLYSNFYDSSPLQQNFSIGYEYSSKGFSSLGYRPDIVTNTQFQEHLIQTNYSFAFDPSLQAAFYANLNRAHEQSYFDKSAGISFSGNLNSSDWRYNFGVQFDEINKENSWGIQLSLSYKFSNPIRAKLSHQSRRKATRFELNHSSNHRYAGALSMRAGVERNDENAALFDITSQYSGNRFLFNLDHASSFEQLNSNNLSHQSRVSFASSLAFAETEWTIGKPINDSFALVTAHPSLKENKIILGKNKQQYRASNDQLNTILLSDVDSYTNSAISIDVENLPSGYDLGSGLIVLFPSYKSGHNLTVGTDENISVIATLIDRQEQPLILQVGVASCLKKPGKSYKFFTNKSGRFAITGLSPCRYTVKLNNSSNSKFLLDVIEGEQLQRKGKIYVD